MVASWRKMRPASSHKNSIIWCTHYRREQKIFYAALSHGQKENNLFVKVDRRYQNAKMVTNYDNDDDSDYQGNKQEHPPPPPVFLELTAAAADPIPSLLPKTMMIMMRKRRRRRRRRNEKVGRRRCCIICWLNCYIVMMIKNQLK